MNHNHNPLPDDTEGAVAERRSELLADLVLQGLDREEHAELAALGVTEAEVLSWQWAVAELDGAVDRSQQEGLPEQLRLRIEEDARDHFAGFDPVIRGPRAQTGNRLTWLGWLAAAVLLLINLAMQFGSFRKVNENQASTAREQPPAGLAKLRLEPSTHPLARDASGDLYWSNDGQQGYIDIRGLAEVEPESGVYQLWIFDETRDDRFPVDGGMFRVSDANATTIVPIRPSLPIRRPTLFAITLEPPGGVVVSDRKRLLLTASVKP